MTTLAASGSGVCNRLGVAHLLLWTATTAAVLAYLEAPAVDQNMRRSEIGLRIRRANHNLARALSPAYGAALAGATLACWRFVTAKRGFPTQPGHWLLVTIGLVPIALAGARLLIMPRDPWLSLGFCWLALVAGAYLMGLAGSVGQNPLRWRRTFGTTSVGLFALAATTAVAAMFSGSETWFMWYILNLIASIPIVAAIVAAVIVSIFDFFTNERWDAFHWIGVTTFIAIIAHPILAWAIHAGIVGRASWIFV